MSNFHVLAWLAAEVANLPLNQNGLDGLLKTLRERRPVDEWAANCPEWASVEVIVNTVAGGRYLG